MQVIQLYRDDYQNPFLQFLFIRDLVADGASAIPSN